MNKRDIKKVVLAPKGYWLAPIQLTDEMRDAGNEIILDRSKLVAAWAAMRQVARELSAAPTQATVPHASILKGIGKINGDGWKDVTRKGEVVFVWNTELPRPYMAGQYPRIGNDCGWSASTKQYDFAPATAEEAREFIEGLLLKSSAAPATVPQRVEVPEEVRQALQTIARWELPASEAKWDDGTPMSYGAAYGSNGERDYMRQIALEALAKLDAAPVAQEGEQSADTTTAECPACNGSGEQFGSFACDECSGPTATLLHAFSFTPHPDGWRYLDTITELCWRAWQQAAPDERRNIAEVQRTSDMVLSIRFLSARACSAFERYLAGSK